MRSEPDSQQTQAITPASSKRAEDEWAAMLASTDDDTQSTTAFAPATPSPGSPVSTSVTPPDSGRVVSEWEAGGLQSVHTAGSPSATLPSRAQESLRGFYFGFLAALLIVVIALIYTWTILPDGGLRDTIQRWIDRV